MLQEPEPVVEDALAPEVAPEEAEPPKKYFYIQGCDGPKFKISEQAAQQSELLKNLISNLGYNNNTSEKEPIPLANVQAEILEKIVAWCEHNRGEPKPVRDESVPLQVTIPAWDERFLDVDNSQLFDLLVAANYLDIERLMLYACKKVALMAKGKSPEEMRKIYAIPTDEEDEQEAEIERKRMENSEN